VRVATLLLALVAAYASPASARTEAVGREAGTFTWSELGNSEPVVVGLPAIAGVPSSYEWVFRVDEYISQGKPLWWYVRLIGEVNIERTAESRGIAYLWVSVNGWATALLKYTVNGTRPIEVTSINYRGSQESTMEGSQQIDFNNVLPDAAVYPGDAGVVVYVESIDNPGRMTVRLAPQSAFQVRSDSPFPLALEHARGVQEDEVLALPFRMRSSDPAGTQAVTVSATAATPGVEILDPTTEFVVDRVDPVSEFHVRVRLSPGVETGRLLVAAKGLQRNEFVAAEFEVRKRRARTTRVPPAIIISAASSLVVGFGLVLSTHLRPRWRP
jgi:hypothetical protein